MSGLIDLTDKVFSRLTVIQRAKTNKHHQITWLCLCECGNKKEIIGGSLRNGTVQSCSCLMKERVSKSVKTHGKTRTRIYSIWRSMLTRCNSSKVKAYKDYGGRGIKVCEEWHKFENFYRDMGDPPAKFTLERKDNDVGYNKGNCKWATRLEQGNNRRNNNFIIYKGVRKTISQFAKEYNLSACVVQNRILYLSWSIDEALTTPVRSLKRAV